ncbi:MAG TPA: maleylpyruvate isomerase family mycothiol-dependent enzyme [Acidimicrobiales bacterium]|nr:maleylpyruvate isomerase family mycothiol-dependent enzyme [Acidimicrobiales bacterium]
MTLGRSEVVAGIQAELEGFGRLIAGLGDRQWATPTRCAGWTVADVAGHVVGTAADVAAGRFAELAEPDAPDRQADERRGRTPAQLADELAGARDGLIGLAAAFDDAAWAGPLPAGLPGTVGFGAEGIWYDAYVHGDDIRVALGLAPERGPGLAAAVSHLAGLLDERGWGPATLELDGVPVFEVGGGGRALRGDALVFVRVATGRGDPDELGLTGPVNVYAPQPA